MDKFFHHDIVLCIPSKFIDYNQGIWNHQHFWEEYQLFELHSLYRDTQYLNTLPKHMPFRIIFGILPQKVPTWSTPSRLRGHKIFLLSE